MARGSEIGDDGLLKPINQAARSDRADGTRLSFLSSRRTQTQAVQRLEGAFDKLASLVDSIHKHLQSQDERTRQIADSLSQLAQSLSQIPDATAMQHRQLTAIAEQLEAGNARAARWESVVSEIPNLADAHRETLNALSDQIDSTRKTEENIVQSMDSLRGTAGSLGDAFTTSVDMLKDLRTASGMRDEQLIKLLHDQNRRSTRLFVVAICLAGILAVAAVAVVFSG